jgi:hypothetical protein
VRHAPRQQLGEGAAVDEAERRLQGVDVPDPLAALQQVDAEIGDADVADPALVDQPGHGLP